MRTLDSETRDAVDDYIATHREHPEFFTDLSIEAFAEGWTDCYVEADPVGAAALERAIVRELRVAKSLHVTPEWAPSKLGKAERVCGNQASENS